MKKFLLLLALLGLATPAAAQNPFSLINFGATPVDTNGGNKSAGTLRVTLATDGTNPTTVFKIDLSGTGANATAIKVDGSAVTQPVSGTFWQATQPVSIASLPSGAVTNAGTFAVQAAESGTWNITNVSGTVSLPTGASTAAKQPALGAAGSASADVITVQGIASMTALKVDGSGVTQPISGSVTATQATGTNLHMVCDSGCSSSTAPADEATFTFGTTPHSPVGGVFQTTATSNALTTGQMGAFQVTAQRALFSNLRNASGTEVGTSATPLQVTGANGTFPVTGTFFQATQPVSIADGSDTTLGAKADAKSTATDTTAVSIMSVLKEISALEQAPASRAVTNAGTFADQATLQTQTDTVMVGGVNVKEINGVAPLMGAGATGTGAQRVNDVASSATGAAVPAAATYVAGLGSGSTGGNLAGATACDSDANINISTATTTLLITGVAGRKVHICFVNVGPVAGAQNMVLIEGTGATCGTGTTAFWGGTTAASGWNFAANGGLGLGSGFGDIKVTTTTGDSVCAVTSAAVATPGTIKYAIY